MKTQVQRDRQRHRQTERQTHVQGGSEIYTETQRKRHIGTRTGKQSDRDREAEKNCCFVSMEAIRLLLRSCVGKLKP